MGQPNKPPEAGWRTLVRGWVPALLLLPTLASCNPFVELGTSLGDLPRDQKVVESKEPPDVLHAVDGTECAVPPARFDTIEVGDAVTCVWVDELASD